MEAEIIVRGEGQARALPDRAVLNVTVECEGTNHDDAYRMASELATGVDEVLGRYQVEIDRATTAALVVQPKTRWRKGESVRTGWRASRTTVVDVVDLARLGDLVSELAAAGAAVAGPWWQLDPTNPVHGQARRLAAEEARRRAQEYAESLGLTIDRVAWVAEPGLRKGDNYGTGGFSPVDALAGVSRVAVDEEQIINVAPDEIIVRAAVEVGFTFAVSAAGT